ncbi:MAG: hypothetical protein ACI33I_11430 [Clostridium sp.]
MESKRSVKRIFLITILMYISTLITVIILNSEENLESLENGPILIFLFYGQLILILINIAINRKDTNSNYIEFKKKLDGELAIKTTIFLLII